MAAQNCNWQLLVSTWVLLTMQIDQFAHGYKVLQLEKNLAANQSSSNSPNFTETKSWLANDGDTNGNFLNGVRCIHSGQYDPLPWWTLDMLQPRAVTAVRVWNRIDAQSNANRFSQISVGVSNDQSAWTRFNSFLFDLCAYYAGPATIASNPILLNCSSPVSGRYLTIYRNLSGVIATQAFLHFCEIDVFTIVKEYPFYASETQPSFSASSSSLLSAWSGRKSQSECLIQCLMLPNCLFALLKPASSDCWLFGSINIPEVFSGSVQDGSAKFIAAFG